ncbi:MAG: GH3 auxin-responsive promoter family protein [Alphaproteobacteria bacterium]|nr:GH3 auxin-responsive promoter family protein [Alphaproteobacteria bacterium]
MIPNFLSAAALGLAMTAVRWTSWRRLMAASKQPSDAQAAVLRSILRRQAETTFGREHGFSTVADHADFARQVPVQTYETLAPLIARQRTTGEPALTMEPPVRYARTSGTTGEPKLLPLTAGGIEQARRLQRVFAFPLFRDTAMFDGRILGIGGAAIEDEVDPGLPIGSVTGHIYATMPWPVRRKYVLPSEVFGIEDYDQEYYTIALLALAERNLTGIATANPSTIVRVISTIAERWEDLLADIEAGTISDNALLSTAQRTAILGRMISDPERADTLSARRRSGTPVMIKDLWPDLRAVVTWTRGNSAIPLAALSRQFPAATKVIDAGYIASELRATIAVNPSEDGTMPLLNEHFLEFVERNERGSGGGDFKTVDRLEGGRQYYVFVTTGDGLYRYDMNDIVEVTGRFNATPLLSFVQKGQGITNITGEKLSEAQVIEAVTAAAKQFSLSPAFLLMLADAEHATYRLYVEAEAGRPATDEFAGIVEVQLQALNIEYREKRRSGRLCPVVCRWLRVGTAADYRRFCVAGGQQDAQFKILALQNRRDLTFDIDRHVASGI